MLVRKTYFVYFYQKNMDKKKRGPPRTETFLPSSPTYRPFWQVFFSLRLLLTFYWWVKQAWCDTYYNSTKDGPLSDVLRNMSHFFSPAMYLAICSFSASFTPHFLPPLVL